MVGLLLEELFLELVLLFEELLLFVLFLFIIDLFGLYYFLQKSLTILRVCD
jgi:hypothetical protein